MRTRTCGIQRLATVALATLAASCSDHEATGTPDGGRFDITEEVVRLVPGGRAQLGIEGGAQVTWLMRNASVASVGSDRIVRALEPGMTWAIASTATARDSVRVVVSFAEAPAGAISFSLGSGDVGNLRLQGVSRIYRPLWGGAAFTNVTASVAAEQPAELQLDDFFIQNDTMVVLRLSGEPTTGLQTIEPWEVIDAGNGQFRLRGAQGALIWIHIPDQPDQAHLYVPVTPLQLEIDRSDIPAEVGPATGRLVGRVAFDAAGLVIRVDHEGTHVVGQVSPEVVRVFAEFDLVQRIHPLGSARMTAAGGPLTTGTTSLSPIVGLWEGGLVVNAPAITADDHLFLTQLWLGAPAVGEFDLSPLAIEELADRSAVAPQRAWAWTESGTLAEGSVGVLPNLALSTGGTFNITRFDPPGTDTFGLLEATLETTQALVFGGAPNATQTVTLEVYAPIAPTSRAVFPHAPNIVSDATLPPGSRRIGNGTMQLPGRAVETSITPVTGLEIALSWEDGAASVKTNEQGEFLFTGLNPGAYTVSFVVPSGYTLARGQRTSIGPINISAEFPTNWIPIGLADAEGNGALQVIAASNGTNTAIDGVIAHIRRAGSSTIVKSMTTGEMHQHSGLARTKLQPGRYEVDFVLPAGTSFIEGQKSTVEIEVFTGHLAFIPVGVVRN